MTTATAPATARLVAASVVPTLPPMPDAPSEPTPSQRPVQSGRAGWWALCFVLVAVLGVGLWSAGSRSPAGAVTGGPVTPRAAAAPASTVRVVSFNIHGGKGTDEVRDLGRIVAELAGADLAVLNEVHYSAHQGEELAERLALSLLPAPSERRWGRPAFGNAILTRQPVETWSVFPLRHTPRRGLRNVTLATVRIDGVPVRVLGTHLDRGADREAQLETVLALFESLEPPALLLGDLNTAGLEGRLARILDRPDVDDPVGRLAGVKPAERIDWLLLRGGDQLEAVAAGMKSTEASDHPMVWAELKARTTSTRPAH